MWATVGIQDNGKKVNVEMAKQQSWSTKPAHGLLRRLRRSDVAHFSVYFMLISLYVAFHGSDWSVHSERQPVVLLGEESSGAAANSSNTVPITNVHEAESTIALETKKEDKRSPADDSWEGQGVQVLYRQRQQQQQQQQGSIDGVESVRTGGLYAQMQEDYKRNMIYKEDSDAVMHQKRDRDVIQLDDTWVNQEQGNQVVRNTDGIRVGGTKQNGLSQGHHGVDDSVDDGNTAAAQDETGTRSNDLGEMQDQDQGQLIHQEETRQPEHGETLSLSYSAPNDNEVVQERFYPFSRTAGSQSKQVTTSNRQDDDSKTRKRPVVTLQEKDGEFVTNDLWLPSTTSTLKLAPDFPGETAFDTMILGFVRSNKVVLHQTWKTTCVMDHKVKLMRTWPQVIGNDTLKVVYWTDEMMDPWVSYRFKGTRVYEGWKYISSSQQAHIKRADFFRVLLIWYYSGVYADIDIRIKESLQPFLKDGLTTLVWEPERAMMDHTSFRDGNKRKTLMLSGFCLSGVRFSDFLGFYINWIVENHLVGRIGPFLDVIHATGPAIEAEAYYYYIDRVNRHDHTLKTLSYVEFSHYADHFSESTWVNPNKQYNCTEVADVYGTHVLLYGKGT